VTILHIEGIELPSTAYCTQGTVLLSQMYSTEICSCTTTGHRAAAATDIEDIGFDLHD
jgi:hypothetical protein